LRALVPHFEDLDRLGAAVNRILCRDGLSNRFATLVYLKVAAGEGRVRVLNAGHMPPLIVRGRSIDEMPRGSVALGILAEAVFTEQSVDLAERDSLVVYSDGITEAMNAAGEFYGDDRLRAVVRDHAGRSAEEIGLGVLTAVSAFVGPARRHDDVSIVVLQRRA
jgi:serine phosphatase RsbU (regulator of sigma subunit)